VSITFAVQRRVEGLAETGELQLEEIGNPVTVGIITGGNDTDREDIAIGILAERRRFARRLDDMDHASGTIIADRSGHADGSRQCKDERGTEEQTR